MMTGDDDGVPQTIEYRHTALCARACACVRVDQINHLCGCLCVRSGICHNVCVCVFIHAHKSRARARGGGL